MTSATQLTEAEKIELECESLWERIGASSEWESLWERIGASFCKIQREQEAKLDKLLQDLRSTMETTNASSGSRESQMREGEVRMNCSTDHDPLEIAVTPLQKTEKMELSMPLPQKWKPTEVNSIDSKSHVLSFSHNSAYYSVRNSARDLDISEIVDDGSIEQLSGVVKEESIKLGKDAIGNFEEFGNYSSFSLQFCLDAKASGGEIDHGQVMKGMELEQNQLKQTECLSHARQNAPVRELSVGLPILNCYSLSLSWLLNWFPRPTVKLKLMAQCDDELYEGFDDRSKGFVRYGECSIFDARERSVIRWKNGSTLVQMQPDQRSGDPLPGVFDGVYSVSYFGGNVLGDGSYPLGSIVLSMSRGLKRSLVGNFLIQKLLEVCNGEQKWQVLLWVIKEPEKLISMSLNTHGTRMVQRCLQCFSTEDSKFIFVVATKFSNHVSNRCFWTDVRVTKGNLHISLVNEIEAYKMISRKSPCSKRISSPASLFTLLKEIGGLGNKDMGEEATALVLTEVIMVSLVMKMKFLTSLSNWVFDGGGFNRAIYIDALVEGALLTATPNLECSSYECAILQPYNMLLVDVSWELVDESMVVGRESVMSMKNALAILGKEWGKSRRFVLQFDTNVKGEG